MCGDAKEQEAEMTLGGKKVSLEVRHYMIQNIVVQTCGDQYNTAPCTYSKNPRKSREENTKTHPYTYRQLILDKSVKSGVAKMAD